MSEGSVTIRDSLLNSPTNLKEAIDWILRVTNKDGQGNGEEASSDGLSHCLCPLSQAVVTVLRDVQVKEYLDHQEELNLVQDILDKIDTIGGVRTTRNLIEEVASKLADLIGYKPDASGGSNGTPQLTGNGIGCPGNGKGCSHNNTGGSTGTCPGYQSSYNGMANLSTLLGGDDTGNTGTGNDWTILAKILLGAIPFIFSGLSFMYWSSVQGEGKDRVNSETQLLGQYMKRMGYDTSKLREGKKNEEGYGDRKDEGPANNDQGFTGNTLNSIIEKSKILGDKVTEGKDIHTKSFAEYLEKLREKVKGQKNGASASAGSQTQSYSLLKLSTLCTGYFRALNQPYRVHQRKHRLPRTIREILYWLSCVQYCPVFRVLVQKMQELCRMNGEGPKGEITFYAQKNDKIQTCLITPQNCVSYFLSAALVAPMVLLSIQDTIQSLVPEVGGQAVTAPSVDAPVTSEGTEGQSTTGTSTYKVFTYEEKIEKILKAGNGSVYIHDLYSNSLFEFRFPMSETQSYYVLQDCLVALYYQMYFLKQQCNWERQDISGDGFGWAFCRYGDGVNSTGCGSWICPKAGAATESSGNDYAKTLKDHTNECGQQSSASPLQAFLTDCLPGFTCEKVKVEDPKSYKYPEFLEHRGHCPPGQYCPIPMGFRECFRTAAAGNSMSGLGINAICAHYANDDLTDSCLYQLVRCICSLTRRVPRSTGTLYGFFQGIISVYGGGSTTGKQDAKAFQEALDKELQLETFGLPGSVTLMKAVMEWKTKTGSHTKPGDCSCLDSLSGCETGSAAKSKTSTCGKYLHPISGSLYNSVATQYTDTYLSWILYLTGVLKAGLESLQKAFRDIDCSKSGCRKADENGVITKTPPDPCECPRQGCTPSTHGVDPKCCCHSVVHCAGVFPVFYRFGFSIHGPSALTGKDTKGGGQNAIRKCHDFYKQLQRVIRGQLFSDLLSQIRAFLYTTRLPFGLVIFGFWSIVLLYLLWSMTVNLDLMHIQSHWRSPRSYLVPLQKLLADGSRNVNRVCTIGYFGEGRDDLVSLGVSDVYL